MTLFRSYLIPFVHPLSTSLEKPTDDKLAWEELAIPEAIDAII
jgi:hypothetical protein